MSDELHVFTFPQVSDWHPASLADLKAIGDDLVLYGNAFATKDGRRVDPLTVTVKDGHAYGGIVRLPTYPPPPPPGLGIGETTTTPPPTPGVGSPETLGEPLEHWVILGLLIVGAIVVFALTWWWL